MITNGIIALCLGFLARAAVDLCRSYRRYKRNAIQREFHAWRKEQQSKWRVTHPPAYAECFDPWEDIPVFTHRTKK